MTLLTRSALELADDRLLADRAADGDTRAFTVLASRYRRLLRAYATRVLGSDADADDVVQDTLVTAWQQLPTLRDGAALRGWLLQIASRKAVDRIRDRKPHADVDDLDLPAPGGGPADEQDLRSVQQALGVALAALPEQQRQAWVLRELGGRSYEEIAEALGLPPSTVRGLLARARTRLVRDLQEWR